MKTKKSYKFSEKFWKKVQETFSIYNLLEVPPKKAEELYELDADEMNIDLLEAKKWSKNNVDLYDEIQINGYNKAICNKIFIRGIYEELVFDKENIEELDSEITSLRNLKLLSLNHNSIQKIANIPPNLKELSLYYNLTISIHEKIHQENLLFLGLGYNLLTNDAIEIICFSFPNLLSLDLAFNLLTKIDETVENLVKLSNLKNLILKGNPFSLMKAYKDYVLSQLKVLRYFDSEKISLKEIEKTEQKSPIKKQISINTDNNKSQVLFINPSFTNSFILSINIRTLENVSGVLLESYQFPDFSTNPLLYQSTFWVSVDFVTINFNSKEKPCLFENATTENERSRIDFEINIKESLQVNEATRDAFRKGIILKFYVAQPKMILNEETQEKLPKLKEDGKPELEENILGICLIDTMDWLITSNEKKKQLKTCIFPTECLDLPEYYFPKKNEKDLIQEFFVPIPEKVEEDDKTKDKKKEAAAKAKKDVKKDVKKPPPGKKGAKEEIEKKLVPIFDWPKIEREKVFVDKNNIKSSLKDLLVSISLEIL